MADVYFPYSEKEAKKLGIENRFAQNEQAGFPKRLRQLRENNGETLEVAAKEIGVTRSTLGLYEKGENVPDIKVLVRIARHYGATVNYLTGEDERPTFENDFISKQTGLTNDAIAVLRKEALDIEAEKLDTNPVADFISKLITSDEAGYLVKLALGIKVFEAQEKAEQLRNKQTVLDEDSSILAIIFDLIPDNSRPISKFDLFATAAKHKSMEIYGDFFTSLIPDEEIAPTFSKGKAKNGKH